MEIQRAAMRYVGFCGQEAPKGLLSLFLPQGLTCGLPVEDLLHVDWGVVLQEAQVGGKVTTEQGLPLLE